MIEDSGQVQAGKKVDELRESKDIGVEQQTDECVTKSLVSIEEAELPKDTEETDLMKAEESDKTSGLDKKLKVKGIVEFEDERKSEDAERKSNELEIQLVDVAGNDPKVLMDLDKEPESGTPIKTMHDMDARTHARAHILEAEKLERGLNEESRNISMEEQRHCYPSETTESEEPPGALDSAKELAGQASEVGRIQEEMVQSKAEEKEEEIKHDYRLEMVEVEGRVEESEFNTPEELERQLSEEAQKREELILGNVISSLQLLIRNIEYRMHARMPNDLRRGLDECIRKVVEVSISTLKRSIRSLEYELMQSNDLRYWVQGQVQRLCKLLRNNTMKENLLCERIYELQVNLNSVYITLQASDKYGRQLLEKYDDVTSNIEHEMQKHRNLCEEYRNLRKENEKLKANYKSRGKSRGGREDADKANKGAVKERAYDGCPATELEEQMSLLAQSQRELKKKVRGYHKIPQLVGRLNAEKVEGYELLDNHRMGLLEILKTEPRLQCELIEEALTTAKKDFVSTASQHSLRAGSRQGPGIERTLGSRQSRR
jgi:hypothetical protein